MLRPESSSIHRHEADIYLLRKEANQQISQNVKLFIHDDSFVCFFTANLAALWKARGTVFLAERSFLLFFHMQMLCYGVLLSQSAVLST